MRAIKIWEFYKSPKKYQEMSTNGGDEDWVALIPKELDYVPSFMEEGTSFGCCSVDRFNLKNGDILLIGSHA